MTAVAYPDCWAASPNGRWLLEARSPDNGPADFPDGEFHPINPLRQIWGGFQQGFRYRLWEWAIWSPLRPTEVEGGRVVWQRRQAEGEQSPHELVVADDGWSVIRDAIGLVVIAPSGVETVQIEVTSAKILSVLASVPKSSRPSAGRALTWIAERMAYTSAGRFWADNSWPYFVTLGGRRYFVWLTSCGQRLVLDFEQSTTVADSDCDPTFDDTLITAETAGAQEFLAHLAPIAGEVQRLFSEHRFKAESPERGVLLGLLGRVVAAVHLVGIHRIASGVRLLRAWEPVAALAYSTESIAMRHVYVQRLRPSVHHALRLLGQEPLGYPAYTFDRGQDGSRVYAGMADRGDRVATLDGSMSAEAVLALIGPPDHLRGRALVGELGRHRWTEEWEYDFRVDGGWRTLRVAWEKREKQSHIVGIEDADSYWLNDDVRSVEYLDF